VGELVPFPAETGAEEKLERSKNVADEDLAEMRSLLRPYKRNERSRRFRMQGTAGKKSAGIFFRRRARDRLDELRGFLCL